MGKTLITSIRAFQRPCHCPFLHNHRGVAGQGGALFAAHGWTLGLRENSDLLEMTGGRLEGRVPVWPLLLAAWLTHDALILTSPFYSER